MTSVNTEVSIIITAWNEPVTIRKVLRSILDPSINGISSKYEIIIVTPDIVTWNAAKLEAKHWKFLKLYRIKDKLEGKPKALNMAFKKARGKIFILTDGDTEGLSSKSIRTLLSEFQNKKVGAAGGRPVSADSRDSQFGFYGHLHCEAAHQHRIKFSKSKKYYSLSGYLYAIRNLKIQIPQISLAEDAWITNYLYKNGYELKYTPKAEVKVHFPKNFKDWLIQKTRSLGGNIQLNRLERYQNTIEKRSITQDISMSFFPLRFAKSAKEFFWALLIYPLRLLLWIRIFFRQSLKQENLQGKVWDRIESTKY